MPTHHDLPARPELMVWGYLDATTPPVLTIDSGDTVSMTTVPAGGGAFLHPNAAAIPPEFAAVLAKLPQQGTHILTGPVHVRGAAPGTRCRSTSSTSGHGWGGASSRSCRTGAPSPTIST